MIFIELASLGWLCAAIAVILCTATALILRLVRRTAHLEKLLFRLLKERVDHLEVEQHRHPDPNIEADLYFCQAVLFELSAPKRRRQVRRSFGFKLKAIANPRLHWRIWRRPLAAPEPTEIATDI